MGDHYIEYGSTGKPHPYHLVRPSIWPLASSFAAGLLAVGAVMYMHEVEFMGVPVGFKGIIAGFLAVITCMFFWWKDIVDESVIEKVHNAITEIGLRYGMMLFIASEIMFFVAFFWAFFDMSLFPREAIGFVWPPENIHVIDAFSLPFLMTVILLLSGCSVTWAHHAILEGDNDSFVKALKWTVILGVIFLGFQVYEYTHVTFGFTEGVYASTFYMATGFHGFHVFIGTVFLYICYLRGKKGHFTKDKHFGFEAAAWYWHFVDVVWLFLFVAIYVWGGMIGTDATPIAP
jgi:cytochrome c oxidase subunit 3